MKKLRFTDLFAQNYLVDIVFHLTLSHCFYFSIISYRIKKFVMYCLVYNLYFFKEGTLMLYLIFMFQLAFEL